MARYGSAAATVAGLWIDVGLAPDVTLALEASVFEASCGLLEARRAKAEIDERHRRHVEDMRAASQMHAVLHRNGAN